jgi:hypothetical protein
MDAPAFWYQDDMYGKNLDLKRMNGIQLNASSLTTQVEDDSTLIKLCRYNLEASLLNLDFHLVPA